VKHDATFFGIDLRLRLDLPGIMREVIWRVRGILGEGVIGLLRR
jgi:hypothetical protein